MQWKNHLEVSREHSLLSPSQPSFLNLDDEGLLNRYMKSYATEAGTILHKYAEDLIRTRFKLENNRTEKKHVQFELARHYIPNSVIDIDAVFPVLRAYVNDGIGFAMIPEKKLVCDPVILFGTADTICFRDNHLRIHDLKTGTSKVKMEQLLIYAALFCIDYEVNPDEIDIDLRIYQTGQEDVICYKPTKEEMHELIHKLLYDVEYIKQIRGVYYG